MLYELMAPDPWIRGAAHIDVWSPWHDEEVLVNQLYAGRTPRSAVDWRGFPLIDIEARLLGSAGKLDVQDFAWGGMGDIIVTDRLLRILQEGNLTGIGTRAVSLGAVEVGTIDLMEDDPSYEPPRLHRLVARGIVERAHQGIPPPGPEWRGILDLESWTGHDFSVAWGSWLLTFVSQRFVDCLKRHDVRNYRVAPGREFTFNGHRYIAFRAGT